MGGCYPYLPFYRLYGLHPYNYIIPLGFHIPEFLDKLGFSQTG